MRPTTASTTDTPDGVGTHSRQPPAVHAMPSSTRSIARSSRLEFEVPFSPRVAVDETFVRADRRRPACDEFLRSYPVNITAPTDDSPFFFNMLRLRDICRPSLLDFGKLSHNMKAVATLGILLVTVTVLTARLHPPAAVADARSRAACRRRCRCFAFFIAIGLGFMLIETSQMQRLIIALGHPTYGLSVVLFALLLSSGLGSFLTESASPPRRRRPPAGAGCWSLVAVLAVFGAVTPAIVRWIEPMTTAVRILAAVLLLFPAGLFMGMAFPLGDEAGVGARARADAVALGPERRGLGAGLGAERLHRADVVDLDRVLDRLALLRRGARGLRARGADLNDGDRL